MAALRKVAIFDIDGTIFRSSLLIELLDDLIAEKLMPRSAAAEYRVQHARWLDRKGSYEDYIGAVIGAFMRHLPGVPRHKFQAACGRVVEKHGLRTYRFTSRLVADLKRRGYFLLAISNSPKDILDRFCPLLGFDLAYGRLFATDERGRFTGETEFEDLISDKGKILKRAAAKHGLTLKGSVGVGDSEADVRFLRLVEKPICFNPNSRLLAAAKRRGWRVVVERKDVIYEM